MPRSAGIHKITPNPLIINPPPNTMLFVFGGRAGREPYPKGDNMKDKIKNEKTANTISTIALIVSFFSVIIAFTALYWDEFRAGGLVIHPPTTFCIVRGYKDIGFPSDHLVIPLVIENTGKGVKTLQTPSLRLKEKNSGQEYRFLLTGTIPDLYRVTLDESYQVGFSVHIPENSVREYYLVFHVQSWWDENKPEYFNFEFTGKQEWDVSLSYLTNNTVEQTWRSEDTDVLFTMPIYTTIDRLQYGESYNSDCFSVTYDPAGEGQ
jgi:hypothetical protein